MAQWSDGIGEACFAEWSQAHAIDLDLAPFASEQYQPPEIFQVDDGRPAPRFAHLAKAAWNNRIEVLREAVAAGAELNAIYDGHTALLLSIMRGNVEAAILLIMGGADVNRPSTIGTTPLIACADIADELAAISIANKLLERGADKVARDGFDRTAYDAANKRGKAELAKLLCI